ncbi:MAG TPA: hypothetical protein VJM32_01280 [Candidatus Saccharimonadales bacterium]|nr:hypothetical protein [Candidatus Saccharimonadales bacterium]
MPRTRIITDQKVFEAAIQLVSSFGVASLTFASLGQATSLAPPTLVQRFKTKQGLLSATTSYCLQRMESSFKEVVQQNDSPLAALTQGLMSLAGAVTSVQAFANGQAFLQLGLTNPDLAHRLRSTMASTRDEMERLLNSAVVLKELRPCNTRALAQALQAMYEGGIITWAVYQQKPIEEWVGELLQAVIEPYKVVKER